MVWYDRIFKKEECMILTVPSTGFVPIEEFKDLLDISKVVYYSIEDSDGTLTLKFYDKNEKLVKPYKEDKNGKVSKKVNKNK